MQPRARRRGRPVSVAVRSRAEASRRPRGTRSARTYGAHAPLRRRAFSSRAAGLPPPARSRARSTVSAPLRTAQWRRRCDRVDVAAVPSTSGESAVAARRRDARSLASSGSARRRGATSRRAMSAPPLPSHRRSAPGPADAARRRRGAVERGRRRAAARSPTGQRAAPRSRQRAGTAAGVEVERTVRPASAGATATIRRGLAESSTRTTQPSHRQRSRGGAPGSVGSGQRTRGRARQRASSRASRARGAPSLISRSRACRRRGRAVQRGAGIDRSVVRGRSGPRAATIVDRRAPT